MKKTRTLKGKLLSIIFAASLLTMSLFAVISQLKLRENIRYSIKRQIQSSMEKTNQCLDLILNQYTDILYGLCTDEEVLGLVESLNSGNGDLEAVRDSLRQTLSHVSNSNTGVKGIVIRTARGETLYYDGLTASSERSQWADKVGFSGVEQGEAFSWLDHPVRQGDEDIYLIQIERRLVDYREVHKKVGTAVISVDEEVLESIVEFAGGEIYLCDADRVIYAPDQRDIGKTRALLNTRDRLTADLVNEKTGWTVMAGYSLDQYHKTVREQAFYQALIAAAFVLLMYGLIHYFTKPLVKSVDQVMDAMNSAESGDYSVRISVEEEMPKEIQRIALGFNELMGQSDTLLKQVRQAVLDQKNAELAALEAQIDPHFLYNALDTINWKAIENEQYEISEMVGALADILRYAVKNAGAETTVGQEITWLNQYILLQEASLGKRLETEIAVNDSAYGCRIHKLLLQPFVENAIKHGFYRRTEGCRLKIHIEETDGQLHIMIEDNGKGIPPEVVSRLNDEHASLGSHMGVTNVRQRLKLYYQDEVGLYFESLQGQFTRVHLFIPARKGETYADRDR